MESFEVSVATLVRQRLGCTRPGCGNQLALARKGKRGWVSPDQAEYSRNLKGNEVVLKQNSWGIEKIWWIPVLVRGKLHVELLLSIFPGEKPEAVDAAISKIPGILNARFPNENKPRIVMSDRGPAFYHSGTGRITPDYTKIRAPSRPSHPHGRRRLQAVRGFSRSSLARNSSGVITTSPCDVFASEALA